jgi:hypothetical protein
MGLLVSKYVGPFCLQYVLLGTRLIYVIGAKSISSSRIPRLDVTRLETRHQPVPLG